MAARDPQTPPSVEYFPWSEVSAYFAAEHRLGEHVAVEGPTGSGKSMLTLELIRARSDEVMADRRPLRITILATKARDATITRLRWPIITSLQDWQAYGLEQAVLWPARNQGTLERVKTQRLVFRQVMDEALQLEGGNQILMIDEVAYFEDPQPEGLGLKSFVQRYWREARSSGVSVFATTQRPAWVSRYMWTESWWMFLLRPEDEDDLKTIAARSGFKQTVLEVLPTLGTHEVLVLRRRPVRQAFITQVTVEGV